MCFVFALSATVAADYKAVDSAVAEAGFSDKVSSLLKGEEILNPKTLFDSIISEFVKEVKSAAGALSAVVFAVLLFSLVSFMSFSGGAEKVSFFILYAAVATVLINNFSETALIIENLCKNLVLFLNAAVPTIGTAVISCGNGAVYGGMYPCLIAVASLSANIIKSIGIPALMLSLAIGVIGNLSDTFNLAEISKTIRSSAMWIICGILTVFSAAVGVCGISAGGVNTVVMRGAKFVARSAIPVLGGLLSDSFDAVVSGGIILKNALGGAAVCGAIIILIYPLIKVGAVIFVYKIAAAIISPFCDRRISNILTEIAGTLSCFVGFAAAEGVVVIISFTSLLSASNFGVMIR